MCHYSCFRSYNKFLLNIERNKELCLLPNSKSFKSLRKSVLVVLSAISEQIEGVGLPVLPDAWIAVP